MNQLQHLLVKLAEEGAEVAQISLKAAQFGAEEVMAGQPFTNFQRCHQELDDLQAIVEMLNAQYGFAYSPNRERLEAKKAKVRKYLGYSIRLGLVDGDQPVSSEVGIPTSEPVAWAAWIDGSDPAKDRPQLSVEEPRAYSIRRPLCFADSRPDRVAELERQLREAEARVARLRGGLEYARGYVDALVENGEAVHADGLLRDIDGFLAGASAACDVLAERAWQSSVGDAEPETDLELAALACYLIMPPGARDWPAQETGYGATFGEAILPEGWPRPGDMDRRRELVQGVAFGLGCIERIDRATGKESAHA